ncbi:MAG: hypothetical protein EOM83_01610 [Clostridia bacterium]|nr:hypothetical protein [Clostridia bacterium]
MKTKSIIIIITTLLIGFVIGFLTNAQITRNRLDTFVNQGSYNFFRHRMIQGINPDPQQARQIEPILEKYAQLADENIMQSRQNMQQMHQQMIDELQPYLTNEQLEWIKNAHQNFRGNMQGRGHRGPPSERGPRHRNWN